MPPGRPTGVAHQVSTSIRSDCHRGPTIYTRHLLISGSPTGTSLDDRPGSTSLPFTWMLKPTSSSQHPCKLSISSLNSSPQLVDPSAQRTATRSARRARRAGTPEYRQRRSKVSAAEATGSLCLSCQSSFSRSRLESQRSLRFEFYHLQRLESVLYHPLYHRHGLFAGSNRCF